MKLQPKHPPGRSTRQARGYSADIAQLRAQGYTFEAIRAALADVGVHVSRSTVQREAARHARKAPVAVRPSASAAQPEREEDASHQMASPPGAETRSAKDIAAAYVRGHITNPLVQPRSRHEDSRH